LLLLTAHSCLTAAVGHALFTIYAWLQLAAVCNSNRLHNKSDNNKVPGLLL